MKQVVYFLLILNVFFGFSQDKTSSYKIKTFAVKDTIHIDSVSINPSKFVVKTKDGILIDPTRYTVDFAKAIITFKQPIAIDSVSMAYLKYPEFLTKVYRQLDDEVIIEKSSGSERFYQIQNSNNQNAFKPFDGLTTSGSISRGITIGNNQNSILNSELDLQISGKLNDKVSLRASIQDANIPLQESGYSQRLDEFDEVFIELMSPNWKIRAGDIDLENTTSYFSSFNKRVQGLMVNANLSDKTSVFASGALVRGRFTTTQFTTQEGNQGPYKLRGENNELFVLIVSGSETVYVNGIPIERGENKDYIIDYNAGEIIFNSTYPITSEMRITVDYQFSDRNYSRFIAFGGAKYSTKKLNLNVSVYSEGDAKNQPLQQNLSAEQTQILAAAGDNTSLMVAPSAIAESFSENRILYRKEFVGTEEIFVFSNNPDDELFSVRFTLVGANQGNYILRSANAVSAIFDYISPISGVPQGNYKPITQLIAPERLQITVLNGNYKPTDKTDVFFELAGSKNDKNLFSTIDDSDNNGYAGKLRVTQKLMKTDRLWNLSALLDVDFIQKNFQTVQRLYKAEFNRDWNLDPSQAHILNADFGNQLLATSGLQLLHVKKGTATYNFEHLDYSSHFNGNKHHINANLHLGKFNIYSNSSFLNSQSTLNKSTFLRSFNRVVYSKKNKWIGAKFALEDNEQRIIVTDSLTPLSQKFNAYETFLGLGDSTNVFTEIGYIKRFNDSIRSNTVQRVNSSNTYYLNSRLVKNNATHLQLYLNYRNLKSKDKSIEDEQSLNSRLNFTQKLFNNLIFWNTSFETNSGTLPQQDFTYVEVEAGQGTYTWIDYNENSIQEFNEFEVAQFQDQGNYIRVLLPNQVFVRTHQNRFSQVITLNPQTWSNSKHKIQNFLSHFYNQTSFLIDSKAIRHHNHFNINPFKYLKRENLDNLNLLSLNLSSRNVLFFNRGKQHYTTSYTFLSNSNKHLLSIGSQKNKLTSHHFNFSHKFKKSWLLNLAGHVENEENLSENFLNRSFKIKAIRFNPKFSYLFNDNAQFDLFYWYATKENTIGDLERLVQNKYGLSFTYNKAQKIALTGELNVFKNGFKGNTNTPVGYQILEGLQPGKNFTWSLIAQKKLTPFLDLNLNYFGRKTETSKVVHTGTIQLKAYF